MEGEEGYEQPASQHTEEEKEDYEDDYEEERTLGLLAGTQVIVHRNKKEDKLDVGPLDAEAEERVCVGVTVEPVDVVVTVEGAAVAVAVCVTMLAELVAVCVIVWRGTTSRGLRGSIA